MRKKIATEVKTDYNIFGVDTPENEILGVIRMSGRYKRSNETRTRIRGICVPFQFNSLERKMEISIDSPFFYGDYREFVVHYNSRTSPVDLNSFQDGDNPLKHGESAYYSVPLDIMQLKDNQMEILNTSIKNIENITPFLSDQMIRYTIDSNDEYSRRQFGQRSKSYPLFLKEHAISNGSYYSGKVTGISNRDAIIIDLQPVRIFSTPFGGFKGWKEKTKKILSKRYQ